MGKERHNWGEVIALTDYRKLVEPPQIAQLRGYWDGLRAGRPAPARSEIDPHRIAPVLAHAFILDRIAPGHARLRVAGTQLCDLMGMEVRGMPLSSLFHISSREHLAALLGEVFSGQYALRLGVSAEGGLGRPALVGQMLLLPLTDREGATTRALGGLVVEGTIGFAPRRLSLSEVFRSRIISDQMKHRAPAEPAPGVAEAPRSYRPRPALRVIRNDD